MRVSLLLLVVSLVVLLLIDWFIWNDCRSFPRFGWKKDAKKRNGIVAKVFIGFSLLVIALFVVAICLPHRAQDQDLQPKMWILFLILTVVLSELVYLIASLIGFVPMLWKKQRFNTGLFIGVPLALILFCSFWWGAAFGRRIIEVKHVDITSAKVPKSFNDYKIVQFSDMHVGTWGNDTTFLSAFVDSINAQHPDLIVFTGDIVNRQSAELKPFISVLSRLKAKDGVYSILGNHDYGDYISWDSDKKKSDNLQLLKDYQKEMGWTLLNNDRRFIINQDNDTIVLIGVENWGEPPFKQYGDLNKAYPLSKDSTYNVGDNRFKVLLSHNPKHWNQIVSNETNIDLTLSGHTHAMQMMFKLGPAVWSPSKYMYEQWRGLYKKSTKKGEDLNIYVNVGGGEVGWPMRIGAYPEITVITLKDK